MTGPVQVIDKDELRATLARAMDFEPHEVGDDTRFVEDLGVDSLMALEVVVVLERKYRVRFSEEEMRAVDTVDTAHRLLESKAPVG